MSDTYSTPPAAAPPSNGSPVLERYGKQMETLGAEEKAAFEKSQAALAPKYSALSQTLAQPRPAPPEQQKVGPAPKPEDFQKDAMAFASAMAVLGAVAGRFTRTPGEAALNAFAGAVNGWQSGNLEQYQSKVKEWEANTKATVENNRQVLEKYKQTLDNRKANIDEQMSQIQLIAAQYHDKMMYDAAAAKNYTLVADIYQKNFEYTQKTADSAAKLKAKYNEDQKKLESTANYWLSPDGVAKRATLTPEQNQSIDAMIKASGNKGQPRNATAMALRKYMDENPDATAEDIQTFAANYAGSVAAERTRATAEPGAEKAALTKLIGQRAAISSFEQTAVKNGDALVEMADKIDRTGVPVIERWIRGGRQATGDPEIAKFNAQMNVYRAEVAKIITNPNLSGVLSDSARREVDSFISGAASAPQIKAVVGLLKQDFGRRTQSIDDEIAQIRGRLQKPGTTRATTPAPTGGAGGGMIKYDADGNRIP